MRLELSRRAFLAAMAAGAVVPPGQIFAAARKDLILGEPQAFSFERLLRRARDLSKVPFAPRPAPPRKLLEKIDYDAFGAVSFDCDYALFAQSASSYPATFFPLAALAPKPVRIYALEKGMARQVVYSPRYFKIPPGNPLSDLPVDAGFAGFRLQELRRHKDWRTHDWAAFLGASYFRAIGELGQYGLSARGVAVNTGLAGAEEFPDFSEMYIQPAASPAAPVIIHALLEGPSLTGAFRFELRRGAGVVMNVSQRLFLRPGKQIERLGIAPLTSMFWHDETRSDCGVDWRPEVHDSDGLALWTGAGERLWRGLNNPDHVVTSSFIDHNPRGFGLLQRDRNFDHYLGNVHYERRPSVWVEPMGEWGKGSVQLVEIPTGDEVHDNIVAFWNPLRPARSAAEFSYDYRLHWLASEPYPPVGLAQVVATRTGAGGTPGAPRLQGVRKFVIEFAGGSLATRSAKNLPQVRVSTSRGELSQFAVEPIPTTTSWRMFFDLAVDGPEPVELRASLQDGDGTPLTEVWLYQYWPRDSAC